MMSHPNYLLTSTDTMQIKTKVKVKTACTDLRLIGVQPNFVQRIIDALVQLILENVFLFFFLK